MTLDDRLTRGLLAGIIAGVVATTWNLFSYYIIHFAASLYLDFAAVLIYGKEAVSLEEKLFGQLVTFMFFGIGGTLFAYFIRFVTSKNLVLKGWFVGTGIWFLSYTITILFKVDGMSEIPLRTAVSHVIGASMWGISLAIVFNYLDKKVKG